MSDAGQMFDDRERYNDPEEATRSALDDRMAKTWTMLPIVFKKHDREKNTVHVQPTIKLKRVKADRSTEWREFPVIEDIPMNYPGGGGATWTFPVKDGDEGMLVVSSRSFDKWWQQGGVQEQDDFRMHHFSDSFAIPGFRSQPRRLSNISEHTAQLRSDDGSMSIDFNPQTRAITINSPHSPVQINGDLHVSGDVVWDTANQPTHAKTHRHLGVVFGSDHSLEPVPGS